MVTLTVPGAAPLARADPQRTGRSAVAYLTEVGEKGYPVTADGGWAGWDASEGSCFPAARR